MANKDKGGSKSSKTAASKSLKEKRQAKKAKAARSGSSSDEHEIVEAYRPLVAELHADYVSIQIACSEPEVVIQRAAGKVLPMLRQVRAD